MEQNKVFLDGRWFDLDDPDDHAYYIQTRNALLDAENRRGLEMELERNHDRRDREDIEWRHSRGGSGFEID
jgi:hypothetical protein